MSIIGLDSLYYAKITEAADGTETYDTPKPLGKAISANLSIEFAENTLYADNGVHKAIKRFKSGKLSLGTVAMSRDVAEDLFGARIDKNGVIVTSSDDIAEPVAIGYRALKDNERYRYTWLYRVKFSVPSSNIQTQGDNITFQTPTLEGTVMRRNKKDDSGKHPVMVSVDEDDPESTTAVNEWFEQVYEIDFE